MRRSRLVLVFALLLAPAAAATRAAAPAAGDAVRTTVMSFNIRYGTADDGPNAWEHRRYLVRLAIRERQPAIFGVQECLWEQGVELERAFSEYRITGVGRDDGKRAGEMCLIFSRRDRYRLLDQGNFWLSETPQTPGSLGWDAACPRLATWVKLYDRLCDPDTLFVFNTHLDHRGNGPASRAPCCCGGAWARSPAATRCCCWGTSTRRPTPAARPTGSWRWKAGATASPCTTPGTPRRRRSSGEPDGTFHGFTGTPGRGPHRLDPGRGRAAGRRRGHRALPPGTAAGPRTTSRSGRSSGKFATRPAPATWSTGSTGASPRY